MLDEATDGHSRKRHASGAASDAMHRLPEWWPDHVLLLCCVPLT